MQDRPGPNRRRTFEAIVLAISLAIVAGVACLPLRVTSLQADDLCRSVRLKHASIVDCVQQDYQTFTGRWLGFGLEYAVLSQVQDAPAYGAVLGIIALIYITAIVFLMGALFPQLPGSHRLLLGALLCGLYWVGLPSTKDSFYWLCGSIEYQLSLAVVLFTIAATITAADRWAAKKSFMLVWFFAMLGAIAAPGLHELYGLMLCIVLAIGSLLAWNWRSAGRNAWFAVTSCALASFLFTFLAPGNAVRSAAGEHSGEFLATAQVAVSALLQSLPDWIFNLRLIVATVLLLVCFPEKPSADTWLTDEKKRILRLVVPVTWCLLLAGAFFAPAWGTGQVVASRTLSAASMIFLLGWFLNWLLIAAWLQSKSIQLITLHPCAKTFVVCFLAVSLVVTGNTRRAIRELAGPIPNYAQAKQHWQELLTKARQAGADNVVLPPIIDRPTLIGFSDITGDPGHWINGCAAKYHGVREVRAGAK